MISAQSRRRSRYSVEGRHTAVKPWLVAGQRLARDQHGSRLRRAHSRGRLRRGRSRQVGVTASYRRMREAVRDSYRADPRLREQVRRQAHLNPGGGWVSGLCAEPGVIHGVLQELLAPHRAAGNLRLLQHYRPVRAQADADLIRAVEFTSSRGGEPAVVHAAQVIDATEEGDLLPLTGCEHVLGAESSTSTGEPHARSGPPDRFDQQALTWCAALELRPAGQDHVIERPARYGFWRSYQAPFWPGPQLGWATPDPQTSRPLHRPLFGARGQKDLWQFRRIRHGASYQPPLCDVTLVNWPQNDYWLAPITGVPADVREQRLADARELTRCLVYWLQTEAPRPDGGSGYPQLRLAAGALGTPGGLAAAPYIRESRRIRAEFTVTEQHVEHRRGRRRARRLRRAAPCPAPRHPRPAPVPRRIPATAGQARHPAFLARGHPQHAAVTESPANPDDFG
ncbi:MAG: FAD-dependent oxidoreductase [Streptosporangiaceae bacterium]